MSTIKLFNSDNGFPHQTLEEVRSFLDPFPAGNLTTTEIRQEWADRLGTDGWVSNYLLPNSRMHVSFWRSGFGLCVQLGNTCRANSDMLKLETLFKLGRIDAAALVVPTDSYSKFLGSNHASVGTAERDLTVFDVTITLPIAVVGVEPERG
jgi:hypothetical protein